ncbi:MAG: glutamate--tRNA ligase [Candidatus Gracilibacteria bacterium]|nr:glutamate--tRNA ligase [Candidatus Gracilibacteria bacterium]
MITTRFAPSPTGYVHIGSLRTVLYNYLFAKKNKGKFMLRIEDTDRTRYVEGSIDNMISVLNTFGLTPDEGPNNPGDKGPYMQSERLDIYQKYINILLEKDLAYYCFCSSERLDELRKEQEELKLPTKYDQACRYLTKEEVEEKLKAGHPYTIRLKVPKNENVVFEDMVKGKIEINTKDVDDQVLIKSDSFPTYHFAVVVDDHLMGVTHVIRGDEWVPSTPKHILLYRAFGWDVPVYSHLPLLLGIDKKKLSKRTGDVACEVYLEKGYLIEAILNYIALLGWNPKTTEEIFSMEELIEKFDLEQIHKAGAVFDVEKLNWFNSKYIVSSNIETLYTKLCDYLAKYDKDFYENIFSKFDEVYNKKILKELQTRLNYFAEFKDLTKFFYTENIACREDLFINPKMKIEDISVVKKALNLTIEILKNNSDFSSIDEMKNKFIEEIQKNEMKNGQVLWPARVALTGEEFSPGALEMIYILGNKKASLRIEKILNLLK